MAPQLLYLRHIPHGFVNLVNLVLKLREYSESRTDGRTEDTFFPILVLHAIVYLFLFHFQRELMYNVDRTFAVCTRFQVNTIDHFYQNHIYMKYYSYSSSKLSEGLSIPLQPYVFTA